MKKQLFKLPFHYLTTAEDITGGNLDIEVSKDPNSLIFSLLWTVKGQAATFADLRSQLHKRSNDFVNALSSLGYLSSYLLLEKAVHRWVWHGLQLVLTDAHTKKQILMSTLWSIWPLLLTDLCGDSMIIAVLQHDHINSQTAQGPPESLQHVVTHHSQLLRRQWGGVCWGLLTTQEVFLFVTDPLSPLTFLNVTETIMWYLTGSHSEDPLHLYSSAGKPKLWCSYICAPLELIGTAIRTPHLYVWKLPKQRFTTIAHTVVLNPS